MTYENPSAPLVSDPPTDAPQNTWRPADHNPDPRKWSKDEIVAGLNTLPIPSCTLHVHRANRHDTTSDVQALTLMCDGVLTFDAITQIAGLFETPHITFQPGVRFPDAAGSNPAEFSLEYAEPFVEIVVRWEAPVPVSKAKPIEPSDYLASAGDR